jgi:hypothetical protein
MANPVLASITLGIVVSGAIVSETDGRNASGGSNEGCISNGGDRREEKDGGIGKSTGGALTVKVSGVLEVVRGSGRLSFDDTPSELVAGVRPKVSRDDVFSFWAVSSTMLAFDAEDCSLSISCIY